MTILPNDQCCDNSQIKIKLICECFECNDIEQVQRSRKVCPFEKGCTGELSHYERFYCPNCDYSEPYYKVWVE